MSGERFFTPWSLARVAEAVEWEDVLVFDKKGGTNQEQYIKAMAILWERWMRGWSLPDFASAVNDAGSGNFVSGLLRVLSSLKERIYQLKGFYEGLWAGANPRGLPLSRGWYPPSAPPADPGDQARIALQQFFLDLQTLLVEEEDTP